MKMFICALFTTITLLIAAGLLVPQVNAEEQSVNSADKRLGEQFDRRALSEYPIRDKVLPRRARHIIEYAEQVWVANVGAKWVPVKKSEQRAALLDALFTGISNPSEPARCFFPRHKFRASAKGETVELMICFECQRFTGELSSGEKFGGPISKFPEEVFARLTAVKKGRRRK